MRFYVYLFVFLLLISCTDKHGEATITKEFEGQKCAISAVSNRDFSIQGIGGSCVVLPIVIPVSDKYFSSSVLINDSIHFVLEVSSNVPALDSNEVAEYVNSLKFSFADKHFNQFWFYRFQNKMGAKTHIIHRLNDGFSFYTKHSKNEKPNWQNIASPEISFMNLVNNKNKSDDQSFLVWNYISKLAVDSNPYKYIAFKFWETDFNATQFILDYNERIHFSSLNEIHKQNWNLRIDTLIKIRVKEFSKISNASQYYPDEIDNLLQLTLYGKPIRSKPILDKLFEEIFISDYRHRSFWSYDDKSALGLFNKNREFLKFQENEYLSATLELINECQTDSVSFLKLGLLRNILAFKENKVVQGSIIEKVLKAENKKIRYAFLEEQYIDNCLGTTNDINFIENALQSETNKNDSMAIYILEKITSSCR